jgi:hypothetical protein
LSCRFNKSKAPSTTDVFEINALIESLLIESPDASEAAVDRRLPAAQRLCKSDLK